MYVSEISMHGKSLLEKSLLKNVCENGVVCGVVV